MNKRRRILLWVILVGFVSACSWWCCYFPHDPDLLYAAMPAQAVFVSRHQDLAGRSVEWLNNPLIRRAASAAGPTSGKWDDLLSDARTVRMIDRYLGKDLVVGQVPSMPGSGESAWVMASWIGARMHVLRVILAGGALPEAKRQDFGYGRSGWTMSFGTEGGHDRQHFSVALTEGIFLGCISRDPAGAGQLMARVEARCPTIPDLEHWMQGTNDIGGIWHVPESGKPGWNVTDRGWWDVPLTKNGAEFSIFQCTPTRIEGVFRGSSRLRFSDMASDWNASISEADATLLGNMLGDFPACLVILPAGTIDKFVFRNFSRSELRTIGALLKSQTAEGVPGFLCISRWEYAGHLQGFAVPSLIAGIRLKAPEHGDAQVVAALNILNAGYGLGLRPRRIQIGGHDVTMIEGDDPEGYGKLRTDEQVAVVMKEGWMILGSNREAMARMVSRWNRDGEMTTNEWVPLLAKAKTPYWAWMDFESSAVISRKVLALYDLMKYVPGFRTDSFTRRVLAESRAWLEASRDMGTATMWLVHERKRFAMGFVFGEDGRATFLPEPHAFFPAVDSKQAVVEGL